jgi:death on curing protein
VTRYLSLDEVLRGAKRVIGESLVVRDAGLLDSALARPQTTVFGEDAYPSFHEKAAALLHSVVRNHALIDGNKRLAFLLTVVFARLNGHGARSQDEQKWFDLIVAVADDSMDEVHDIAKHLQALLLPDRSGAPEA